MTIDFEEYNKELTKEVDKNELVYQDILEKIKNENQDQLHTMLMKNDFEFYLQNQNLKNECQQNEMADLIDLNLYEKELSKFAGNKKR